MNLERKRGVPARFYAIRLVVTAALLCASITYAFGQERSTDRDNPTAVTANVITDDLDGTDTAYFYKFTAGPGKLTVTIEVKASGTNAGAMLDLFDAKSSRPILPDVLAQGVDGGSERIVNSIQLSGKKDVVIKIKGLKYGDTGGTGTYKVTLDGPVILPQAPAQQGGGAAANNAPAAPAGPPAAANNGAPPMGGGGAAAPAGPNLLQGQLDPADGRSGFHTVNITGPGQVTFGFSVKAIDAKAGAGFAVLNQEGSFALPGLEVLGGESFSKVVTFDKAQTVLLVAAVTQTAGNVGRGTYSVQLSGPAVAGAPAPAGPGSFSGELNPAVQRPSFHFVNVNGPGQVTFGFNVQSIDAKAAAKFFVSGQNGRIAVPALDVQGGESVTKPVTFDKPTTLTIFIQAVKPADNGGGRGTYSIQVSGPVTLIK